MISLSRKGLARPMTAAAMMATIVRDTRSQYGLKNSKTRRIVLWVIGRRSDSSIGAVCISLRPPPPPPCIKPFRPLLHPTHSPATRPVSEGRFPMRWRAGPPSPRRDRRDRATPEPPGSAPAAYRAPCLQIWSLRGLGPLQLARFAAGWREIQSCARIGPVAHPPAVPPARDPAAAPDRA